MAGIAPVAKMTVMLIVVFVTGDAGRVQGIGKWVVAVTIGAGQISMSALQRKSRVTGMVETRVFPARRAVAVFALPATPPIVRVVLRMTAIARRRRVLKTVVLVAIEAARFVMMTNERKTRRVMIKLDVRPPCWRVAVSAFGAEAAAVRVVFRVAILTGMRGVTELLSC